MQPLITPLGEFECLLRKLVRMTSKTSSQHGAIGMPTKAAQREQDSSRSMEENREYAPREQALAFATALAERNAELMRRLA